MSIKYEYSNGDLLTYPQKYYFSPFSGLNFLKAYHKSRCHTLELLIGKIEVTNCKKEILALLNSAKSELSKQEPNKIITENLLSLLLIQNLENDENKSIRKILDIFLKKFEIKKRLYRSYNSEYKETSNDYLNLKNYLLLSAICLITYQKSKNLKYLNTSLKLNDTIITQANRIREKLENILVQFVLKSELNEVSNLCKIKGLKIYD